MTCKPYQETLICRADSADVLALSTSWDGDEVSSNSPSTMFASPSPPCETEYHPSFTFEDADVCLVSKEGVKFLTYSFILRNASAFFKSTFTLPQCSSSETPRKEREVIHVDEECTTLHDILRMISAMELPPLSSFDVIEPILHAAEKFEMPGPISIIREVISHPRFMQENPLKVYALACRYGWEQLAQNSSQLTLSLDLLSPTLTHALRSLSPDGLLRLLYLHRRRRDLFADALEDPTKFSGSAITYLCKSCHKPNGDRSWKVLKMRMVTEIERRSLGDTICADAWMEWPETQALKNARCSVCSALTSFHIGMTQSTIRLCIERLPKMVDFDSSF
jgi:hypothetical protein